MNDAQHDELVRLSRLALEAGGIYIQLTDEIIALAVKGETVPPELFERQRHAFAQTKTYTETISKGTA